MSVKREFLATDARAMPASAAPLPGGARTQGKSRPRRRLIACLLAFGGVFLLVLLRQQGRSP